MFPLQTPFTNVALVGLMLTGVALPGNGTVSPEFCVPTVGAAKTQSAAIARPRETEAITRGSRGSNPLPLRGRNCRRTGNRSRSRSRSAEKIDDLRRRVTKKNASISGRAAGPVDIFTREEYRICPRHRSELLNLEDSARGNSRAGRKCDRSGPRIWPEVDVVNVGRPPTDIHGARRYICEFDSVRRTAEDFGYDDARSRPRPHQPRQGRRTVKIGHGKTIGVFRGQSLGERHVLNLRRRYRTPLETGDRPRNKAEGIARSSQPSTCIDRNRCRRIDRHDRSTTRKRACGKINRSRHQRKRT
jgi:hypothetical protein